MPFSTIRNRLEEANTRSICDGSTGEHRRGGQHDSWQLTQSPTQCFQTTWGLYFLFLGQNLLHPRLALNFWFFCPHLLSPGITDVCYHTWFIQCYSSFPGLRHAGQVLYKLVKILRGHVCMGYYFCPEGGGGKGGGRGGGERGKNRYTEDMDQLSPNSRCNFTLESQKNPTMRHGCNRNKGLLLLAAMSHVERGTVSALCSEHCHWMKKVTDLCLVFFLTQALFINPVTISTCSLKRVGNLLRSPEEQHSQWDSGVPISF